ncbi:hypothetical protein SAMD00019534_109460 [Acytostelium subglobosum LB1]|uniref:hypothetical protein n=1 Tax=Acytostelium subglobosum LB1 TaxID=1410327 RepID=UPI000644C7F5|nr:hypothetical protein SAMD00019534_109460 [Acytostelium subglobosum LB1]GAM27770.1 hypothetical protein SAMD00019534_109460 [Acytostelium subglobosum LB1]|eukprot:XP_012749429.1 hypothetical protein SAMD00019534_109460 [Acytostelium subglobosum LB1]
MQQQHNDTMKIDQLLKTVLQSRVIRLNVMHHVHQIHVVLMRAAGVPLTHIMSGEQFEKERCLSTMLRYGRTDLFMKYFDVFVQAHPHGNTPYLGHLLKVAINTNNFNVVRHLFKFNRDNNLIRDTLLVICKQIKDLVTLDRHDILHLILSELEFINNNRQLDVWSRKVDNVNEFEPISVVRMYSGCRSFKMLQTIRSQCHLFKPQNEPVQARDQLVGALTCDELPDFLELLGGPVPIFSVDIAFYNIMMDHMNNIPLLDCFFSHETIVGRTSKYLKDAFYYSFDRKTEFLNSLMTPDGLFFAKRYRQHLPGDFIYLTAASHGDVELTQWAIEHQIPATYQNHVGLALQHGFVDVAFVILDKCPLVSPKGDGDDVDDGESTAADDKKRPLWLIDHTIDESILSIELLRRLTSYDNIQYGHGILFSPGLTLDTFEFIKTKFFDSQLDEYQHVLREPKVMLIKDIRLIRVLLERNKQKLDQVVANAIISNRHDVLAVLAETGRRVGLQEMVYLGTAEQARVLLDSGCLAPTTNHHTNPLTVIIQRFNDISLVRDFYNMFGNVQFPSSEGPMIEAAQHGNLEIARFLQEHQPDICHRTALERAAINGHMEMFKFIVENYKAEWIMSDLYKAVENGHTDMVDYIIQSHVHRLSLPHIRSQLFKYIACGHLPMLEAYVGIINRMDKEDKRQVIYSLTVHAKSHLPGCCASAMDRGYKAAVCLQYFMDHLLLPNMDVTMARLFEEAYERGHLLMVEYLRSI